METRSGVLWWIFCASAGLALGIFFIASNPDAWFAWGILVLAFGAAVRAGQVRNRQRK